MVGERRRGQRDDGREGEGKEEYREVQLQVGRGTLLKEIKFAVLNLIQIDRFYPPPAHSQGVIVTVGFGQGGHRLSEVPLQPLGVLFAVAVPPRCKGSRPDHEDTSILTSDTYIVG